MLPEFKYIGGPEDKTVADYVNVNGQLARYEEVGISPSDSGLLHGAGLFETLRVRNRKVFRAAQHIERVTRSGAALGISVTLTVEQLSEMIADLCEINGLTDARARLTITRGDLHEATAEHPVPPVTLILSATAFEGYPPALYEKGMTVVVSRYKQNPESPLTGHKSTSYMERLMGLREAQEMKAGEALWFTAGTNFLAEGSISNVFVVDAAGAVATPPLIVPERTNQRLCLPGITRELVMELAPSLELNLQEKLLTIHDVLAAKEVFLTNAMMGIMPVTAIERHIVGGVEFTPGPITKQLRERYMQVLHEETQ
jgi:branched-chain amino acid aminotransferase